MSGDVANAIALLKKLTKVNTKKKHSKPFLPMAALQDCKVRCSHDTLVRFKAVNANRLVSFNPVVDGFETFRSRGVP